MKIESEDSMQQKKCNDFKPSLICTENDRHNAYPHKKIEEYDHHLQSFGSQDSGCSKMASTVTFDDLADFRQSLYDGITDPVNAVKRWLYDANADGSQCPEHMDDESTASTGTNVSSSSNTNSKQFCDDASAISDLTSQYTLKRRMLSISERNSSKRFQSVLANIQDKRKLSSRAKNFSACSLLSCSFGDNYVDDDSFIGQLSKGTNTNKKVKEVTAKNDLYLSAASEKMEKSSKSFPDLSDQKGSIEVEIKLSEDQVELKDSPTSPQESQEPVPTQIQVQKLNHEKNQTNYSRNNSRSRDNIGSETLQLHHKQVEDDEKKALEENNIGSDSSILYSNAVKESQRKALQEIDSDAIEKCNNASSISEVSQNGGPQKNTHKNILKKVSRNKTKLLRKRVVKYPFSRKSRKQQQT